MKIFKSNPSFIECVAVACGGVGLACCLFSAAVSLINYNRMIPIEPVSIWIYGVILIGGVMVSAAGLLLSAARFSTGQAPLVSKNIVSFSISAAALIAYLVFLLVIPILRTRF